MELKKLRLKRNEEKRLRNGHLWIYSNEVNNKETPLKHFESGEQAYVESHKGKFMGIAYVNPHSLICARIVNRRPHSFDQPLLLKRMQKALSLRERLFDTPHYRLVYGESDLLPGLVVDRFGDHLSVQLNSAGMDVMRGEILDTLKSLLNPDSILLRNDSNIRELEGMERKVEVAYGNSPEEVELVENGVKMIAPLRGGQKTGWFYDQRLNRALVNQFAKNTRVLDIFCYVGSFCVQAAAHGAREIWAVDASAFALETAEKNARQNYVGNILNCVRGDAFDVLKTLEKEGEKFDIVVVDPPAFIKRKKDHKEGLRAYHRINEMAMNLLADDGFLLSASCSMHLHREELAELLYKSGRRLGRHVQLLHEGMQGPDHPVHPAIPETRYLKAFLARVSQES